MIFCNPLRKENILLKKSLQNKIVSLNKIIKLGFNFGLVTRRKKRVRRKKKRERKGRKGVRSLF